MTLLAGLVQTDGIAVFADRASIDPYRDIAPGVPAPGAPRTKVFASAAAGVVAGIAGTVSVPGVDLLKAVQQVVARTTAAGVHTQLLVALAAAAPILREHRALPTQVTPFEQPVMTVVLLGTATPAHRHAQLTAYGIPDTGAPVFTSMQRSVVFAPVTVQPDAELMMLTDEAAQPAPQLPSPLGAPACPSCPLRRSSASMSTSPTSGMLQRCRPPGRSATSRLDPCRASSPSSGTEGGPVHTALVAESTAPHAA